MVCSSERRPPLLCPSDGWPRSAATRESSFGKIPILGVDPRTDTDRGHAERGAAPLKFQRFTRGPGNRVWRDVVTKTVVIARGGLGTGKETRNMTAKSALFIPASLLAATLALALPTLNIEILATDQSAPTTTAADRATGSRPRGGSAGVGP
jgi:hypothetical protein